MSRDPEEIQAELDAHAGDRARIEAVYEKRIAEVKAEQPGARDAKEIQAELEALEKDLARELERSDKYRERVSAELGE